jgi:hypothetical protein
VRGRSCRFVGVALAAVALAVGAPAHAKPTLATYQSGFLAALVKGAKLTEVDRYVPPADVRPAHVVHVLASEEGTQFWYVSDGFGLERQPGSAAGGKNVFVELATWADHRDLRIAELLSLLGEAMHQHPAHGAFDAWSYDTISMPRPVYGLRSFVLRPGAEMNMPRDDVHEQLVSVYTVIPLTEAERAQVVNVGQQRARAWVEKRAVGEPLAMLARWKLTPPR